MDIKHIKAAIIMALAFFGSASAADNAANSFFAKPLWDFEAIAGFNIGGAAPIPLPKEIRKIESYNPNLNLQLGVTVTRWFTEEKKWGIQVGAHLQTKGMDTKASVKNYGMEIIQDGKKLSGRWTGKVQTHYHSQQLAIPIQGVYSFNDRFSVNLGPYLAYAFRNNFDGYVTEGYLREGDPTGDKISFDADSRATYDFGNELRKFHWGLQGGVTWTAFKHFNVHANLMWGANGIFYDSFKTVTFTLYPIYLNIGFGYRF